MQITITKDDKIIDVISVTSDDIDASDVVGSHYNIDEVDYSIE